MTQILPWQKNIWQNLLASRAANFPHALLIHGPKGSGKNQFALSLAQTLLCEANQNDACGECSGCQLFVADNHPDFLLVKAEDENKPIKIEQIRNLIEFALTTSTRNRFKIALISSAHNMNHAAANALLKTLEEPPPRILIILTSDHPNLIPLTIKSRCQKLFLAAPSLKDLNDWLSDQQKKTADQPLALITALSGHSPFKVLEFLEGDELNNYQELLNKFLLLTKKSLEPLTFAHECQKINLEKLLNYLFFWITDLLKVKLKMENNLINQEKIEEFKNIIQQISLDNLLSYLEKILSFKALLSNNLNQQLLLEKIWIEWVSIC
jgi:DNA polymerase III subunit delta'